MTLAVLLSAQIQTVDAAGDGLAALLPVAGLTLVERQAEDAAAVGADRLLVLVDAMPPALTAALDRIRARGLPVTVVRDGMAVVAAARGAGRMLLVADGLVAPRGLWETLAGATAPRLLAVSDTPATAALERIDAARRWAGLALVDAGAVAALADLPEDWDPQLALLREAIQAEAPSIPCEPQLFERGDIALLDRPVAAALVEQRLLAKGSDAAAGLFHAHIAMPLARAGARWLLVGQRGGLAARGLTMLGAGAAGVAALLGHPLLAALAALAGLLARGAADTIAAFRPETGLLRGLDRAGVVLFAAAIMASAWAAGTGQLALWLAIGFTLVVLIQLGRLLADRGVAAPSLIGDDGMLWLSVGAGGLAGAWPLALAMVTPLLATMLLVAVWRRGNAV